MTISVGQKFALGPSVTVCFAGEFVWKGHAWARQLISERWKDAPSPVDAAFRYDHNSVLLIKVRTTGPRSGPGQKCWSQHEKPSPRWPLPTGSRFPPPGLSFPEKGQARGVCVCACEPDRRHIQWLSFSPNLRPHLSAAPQAVGHPFLPSNSSLASMTPHLVFLWLPGCSPHSGTWPRGEWRMKSSPLCSSGPMSWPSLWAPSPDSHKDAMWLGGPHCRVCFPSCLFFLLFSASHPGPLPECSMRILPSLSIHPPWVISTTATALRLSTLWTPDMALSPELQTLLCNFLADIFNLDVP